MDYNQPPAIVGRISSAPDCSYLRNAKVGGIRYIFDMSLEEATKIFPVKTGLERIATIQNSYMGSSVSFALYRYKGSKNLWDIAIEYFNATGKPITLRHSKGRIYYLEDKDVHIPEKNDVVFHFGVNSYGRDGEFDLDELRKRIINAYYSCNAGERWLLESELNKQHPKEKQKKAEPTEKRSKIKKQSFEPNHQIQLRQKIIK